jgi:hypothetical protein
VVVAVTLDRFHDGLLDLIGRDAGEIGVGDFAETVTVTGLRLGGQRIEGVAPTVIVGGVVSTVVGVPLPW